MPSDVYCRHCGLTIVRSGSWDTGTDRYIHIQGDSGPFCADDEVAEPK